MQVVYALTKQGTKAEYAKPDMVYALGAAAFTILGPLSEDIENHNNNSVVLRVVYQNSAALFTGDAEIQAENALVEQYGAGLQAGLLKAGHHGSKTSSSDAFLRAVRPDYITICCGIGNTYGHPHKQTLRQCKQLGIKVRRTDINGNIVFDTDGTVWVPRD